MIYQENITIINIYPPNNKVSEYMNQKLTELKEEVDSSTTIVGDINAQLATKGRTAGTEPIGKWATTPQKSRIHIFSRVHGTLSRIDHMLDHKNKLNK